MKKTILTLTLLIVAACSAFYVRCVVMPKHVKSASNETSTAITEPTLKEWINNSVDEDMPPGYVPRYQWAADTERAQLESVWANAATNLLQGNIHGMKECVLRNCQTLLRYAQE